MACYYPVGTHRLDNTACLRPCGMCIGCKLEYARQWALRCVHEAQMHEENSFLTLTYNDKNLPKKGSLEKRHLQLFIKRLRKSIDDKRIRYFACGEYGKKFDRPHYHVCLFGHDFIDKELVGQEQNTKLSRKAKRGSDYTVYRSESLEQVWQEGFSAIGSLTFESAGYVARYCTKKITGLPAEDHYRGKAAEFALMSRRPGIGAPWLERFRTDVYPKDFVTLNGRKMRPPLFYDSRMKRHDFELFEAIKSKRIESSVRETQKRMWQKDKHRKSVCKSLQRRLENGEAGTL